MKRGFVEVNSPALKRKKALFDILPTSCQVENSLEVNAPDWLRWRWRLGIKWTDVPRRPYLIRRLRYGGLIHFSGRRPWRWSSQALWGGGWMLCCRRRMKEDEQMIWSKRTASSLQLQGARAVHRSPRSPYKPEENASKVSTSCTCIFGYSSLLGDYYLRDTTLIKRQRGYCWEALPVFTVFLFSLLPEEERSFHNKVFNT